MTSIYDNFATVDEVLQALPLDYHIDPPLFLFSLERGIKVYCQITIMECNRALITAFTDEFCFCKALDKKRQKRLKHFLFQVNRQLFSSGLRFDYDDETHMVYCIRYLDLTSNDLPNDLQTALLDLYEANLIFISGADMFLDRMKVKVAVELSKEFILQRDMSICSRWMSRLQAEHPSIFIADAVPDLYGRNTLDILLQHEKNGGD